MFPTGEKLHFMGAGGIGVSALAVMAKNLGADVSACDRAANDMTAMLERHGIRVHIGHDAAHALGADLLVYTSAVPENHPERLAAAASEKRGRFLARLMEGRDAWGIAGTHGKTTTSWLTAAILIEAGLDPAVFIGGAVPALDGMNYRLGRGPFVAELDESDASFLEPRLDVAVVTNIESDHLSHYRDDRALFAAFDRFAEGVGDGGLLVAGWDNPASRSLYENRRGRGAKVSFGLEDGADVRAVGVEFANVQSVGVELANGMEFDVIRRGADLGRFRLPLPGVYNVQNALAALAACLERDVPLEAARAALAKAVGVGRRMERLGDCSGVALYSDYAHHPTEVAAAVAAFRRLHPGRTLVVFQPHLFSRTRDYADAFAEALGGADRLLLVDIYPAREEPIPGVTSDLLAGGAARAGAEVLGPVPLCRVAAETERLARDCEAVVMMGAGDIDAVARELAE